VKESKVMVKNFPLAAIQETSNHLWYEIWMTDEIVTMLSSGAFEQEKPLSNALLESFAIHVRNLIYFFYTDSEERYKDDFRDFDLLPDKARWKEIRPPKSQVLIDAYERANKQVAHLSFAEIDKRWPFVEIWQELKTVINFFYNEIPVEKLGDRWKNSLPADFGDQNR
jgi:hypothetical protein